MKITIETNLGGKELTSIIEEKGEDEDLDEALELIRRALCGVGYYPDEIFEEAGSSS